MNAHPKTSYGVTSDLVTVLGTKFSCFGPRIPTVSNPGAAGVFHCAIRSWVLTHFVCASVERRPLRLQLRHLLDGRRKLLRVERRKRADAVAAGKSCRLAEIGIFDVGIGQLAFTQIQPFQPLVAGGQCARQSVEVLCPLVLLLS